ncbi:hypothetical protein F2Q70_00002847 [Brassica cretica]|uniref:Uncharacterized protein n=1 Tax=Brassica cretica TaxID=69181 RepID=A0A8S9IUU1_BRACR|nr:hypothetical protein F2Q70_00002847 [Brassica cretica]
MLQNPSTSARGFGLWTGLKAYWNFPRSVCMSNNCSAAQLTLDAEGNFPLPHTSELIPHTRVSLKMRKGSRNQTSSPTRQFDEFGLNGELDGMLGPTRPFGELAQLLSPFWQVGPTPFAVDRTSCLSPSLDGSIPHFVSIRVTVGVKIGHDGINV